MVKIDFKHLTIATYLTLLRLLLIPAIFAAMIMKAWIFAAALFFLASVTDILDGYFARSLNQVTLLGTVLDPLADKLMLITIYVGLMITSFIPYALPLWFLLLVIVHEILVMGGAVYWGLVREKIEIQPNRLGKLIGVGQFLFIGWILLCGFFGVHHYGLFVTMLLLVAASRLCVLMQYGYGAYKGIHS